LECGGGCTFQDGPESRERKRNGRGTSERERKRGKNLILDREYKIMELYRA